MAVGPVLPLPARSILLESHLSHLIVAETLVAKGRRPLSVVAGIDWGRLILLEALRRDGGVTQLLIFLALFQSNGLEGSRTS